MKESSGFSDRRGFPSGSAVKNPPYNAGDTRNLGSIPGSGWSPGKGTDWTKEATELQRVGHTWSNWACTHLTEGTRVLQRYAVMWHCIALAKGKEIRTPISNVLRRHTHTTNQTPRTIFQPSCVQALSLRLWESVPRSTYLFFYP